MEEFFNKIKDSFKNVTLEFETINIQIDSTEWIEAHLKLRDEFNLKFFSWLSACLLYTSPSPRDAHESRMPSSA